MFLNLTSKFGFKLPFLTIKFNSIKFVDFWTKITIFDFQNIFKKCLKNRFSVVFFETLTKNEGNGTQNWKFGNQNLCKICFLF